MADEVAAEGAPRLVDALLGRQFDEVGNLVLVQVIRRHEPELHCGCAHPLFEVVGVEGKAVAEELDDVVVA